MRERVRALWIAAASAPLLAGCLATPTPLAPAVSGSVGVPHYGVQTGAVELPRRGDGFERFRQHSPNYWGNARLVRLIEEAAAAVEREMPGPPLRVGDLSARHGGKIPGHNSHRTGRDVDLLWYVTTPAGVPVKNPGFIRVGSDALSLVTPDYGYLRIDVPRQWLLFRHLLTSEHAKVQWLFVSREVEALITDYARARGEPLDLIWSAENVMLQPGDSAPHDDHVHVRITCTQAEAVAGCEGGGPHWPWLPEWPALAPLGHDVLAEIAADDPFEIVGGATAGVGAGGV